MKIQTCLFDMGNVLVYFSHDLMCRQVAEVCGASPEDVKALLIDSGLQWRLECGQISEEEFHQTIELKLSKAVSFEDLRHAAADIFQLNSSIVPLLSELSDLGIRLVLLSNTSVTHLKFIQQNFDVLSHFDAMTTSFEVGALKPELAIYEDAIQKAGCPAQHCFYTDDIEPYVLKARSVGIHAEVYTTTARTREALRRLGVGLAE